jgi:hypothetical protein
MISEIPSTPCRRVCIQPALEALSSPEMTLSARRTRARKRMRERERERERVRDPSRAEISPECLPEGVGRGKS